MFKLALAGIMGLGAVADSGLAPAAAQENGALPEISVQASRPGGLNPGPNEGQRRYQLPQTSQGITKEAIDATVNAIDTEDALKYLPSLFLRKRNYGDTQAVLATRTWGVNSSARSLVYVDDILISALIGNNNTNAAPRWGLVAPEQIERIDFLYGPFAAAYPGNSEGGVLLITTRIPDHLEMTAKQTFAFQGFDRYGTKATYPTKQTSATVGDKVGPFSWFVSGNYLDSYSQPLYFITNGSIPKGTLGAFPALNKLGAVADVVGAGGLLHSEMATLNGKFAYDITPTLKATYTFGLWNNDTKSNVQTYLRDLATSGATFAGISGFANNYYTLNETHLANSFSLKSDTKGPFDWDFAISNYYFLQDIQRNPFAPLSTGTQFTENGKIARMDGTNWTNADLKGIWRPFGLDGSQEVSFGLHADRYVLDNPTYATPTWDTGPDATSSLYTIGKGQTTTQALWAQDAWHFAPDFKLTLGGRLESWRASDGFNLATTTTKLGAIIGTTAQDQPSVSATRFSPKASLAWTPVRDWTVTGSFGQAWRFPTMSELYQIVSTGGTYAIPNPNLKPENALSGELAIERKLDGGKIRLSFFEERDHDALISQTSFLTGATPVTFTSNVQAIRNRGVELAGEKEDVLVSGLSLFGSVTYVDSRILKDPTFVSTTGATAVGKHVPYVPDWRATMGVSYRPAVDWTLTVAARYSGKQYSTLDNTDLVPHVFGAFDKFLVVDTRAEYQISEHATVSFGVDNVGNEKYTLYHPFPGRTYIADASVKF